MLQLKCFAAGLRPAAPALKFNLKHLKKAWAPRRSRGAWVFKKKTRAPFLRSLGPRGGPGPLFL